MRNYLRLLHYALRERAWLSVILALTLAASGLAALQPWPMKLLIDHVLGTSPTPKVLGDFLQLFSFASTPSILLATVVLGGLILFALNAGVDAGLTWAWTVAGRRMVYALAGDLFARLQRRSLLFHNRSSVGDSMGRVTGDSWCVYQVVDALMFTPGYALLTMVSMIFL